MANYVAPVLLLVALVVLGEIYFLGRYLATRQEVFARNFYAAFALGFVLYFAVSFLVLLPLVIFNAPLIATTVIFITKDLGQIVFLILRRSRFEQARWHLRDFAYILGSGLILLFTFNYGISQIRPLGFAHPPGFQTWQSFKTVIATLTDSDLVVVQRWLGGSLVAVLAAAVTHASIAFFARRTGWLTTALALIINVVILLLLNFGWQLESLANVFLMMFALVIVMYVHTYQRRRYGAAFSTLVFAAWSFNPNFFMPLLAVAFVGATLYTLLRKPKPLLFWVQLLAPLAAVSTFWISDFSRPLGIAITLGAIFAFIFFTAAGRLEALDRFNRWMTTYRYALFFVPVVALLLAGIIIGSQNDEYWPVVRQVAYVIDSQALVGGEYLNYTLLGLSLLGGGGLIIYLLHRRPRLYPRWALSVLLGVGLILFAVNPAFAILSDRSPIVAPQQNFLGTLLLPLMLTVGAGGLSNYYQKTRQQYLRRTRVLFRTRLKSSFR